MKINKHTFTNMTSNLFSLQKSKKNSLAQYNNTRESQKHNYEAFGILRSHENMIAMINAKPKYPVVE